MRVLIAYGHTWASTTAADAAASRAQSLAAALMASGHESNVVAAMARARPAFRKVGAPLEDPRHEYAVAATIRAFAPDVVHLLGCGGGTSIHLPWIARALGVASIVEVEAAALLCHRGDLVHASGEACLVTDDAARCAACCCARTRGRAGLSAAGAIAARATRWLGDVAPFPTPLAFRNRRDLLSAALSEAAAVVVRDEAGRRAALALDLPAAHLHLLTESHAALLPLWTSLAARPATSLADDGVQARSTAGTA